MLAPLFFEFFNVNFNVKIGDFQSIYKKISGFLSKILFLLYYQDFRDFNFLQIVHIICNIYIKI